jgi:hypothetical protein
LRQHRLDAEHHRAVRVAHLLAFGVVFAVHRRPFLGDLTGGKPEPETEKMRRYGVQLQRAMRLMPVQKNGNARNSDVREHQRDDHHLPPSGFHEPVGQPLHQRIHHRRLQVLF